MTKGECPRTSAAFGALGLKSGWRCLLLYEERALELVKGTWIKSKKRKLSHQGNGVGEKTKDRPPGSHTYLHIVHLELADDLDGHLASGTFQVPRTIHVAESAVAHLLDELPTFQTGVFGEFAAAGILLGYELRDIIVGDPLALGLDNHRLLQRGVAGANAAVVVIVSAGGSSVVVTMFLARGACHVCV